MMYHTRNNKQVILQRLIPDDFDNLLAYLNNLSPATQARFGPHSFNSQAIQEFYGNMSRNAGYIAKDAETSEVIAYAIIRLGYLEHDSHRLRSYGLTLDHSTDCTFAPSVADVWQSLGLGDLLFRFIVGELTPMNKKRIILWGGVQGSNEKAIRFYSKNGFITLGGFEYNGWNYDMIAEIA
jgi:GNAT superfamily N-acetyltransferase